MLKKQSSCRWFKTLMWRHCNAQYNAASGFKSKLGLTKCFIGTRLHSHFPNIWFCNAFSIDRFSVIANPSMAIPFGSKDKQQKFTRWRRHDKETLSVPPITRVFLIQRVINCTELWYFLVVRIKDLLNKRSNSWWFRRLWCCATTPRAISQRIAIYIVYPTENKKTIARLTFVEP